MRLWLTIILVLLASLGIMVFAKNTLALQPGVNGDGDCSDCHFFGITSSEKDTTKDILFVEPVDAKTAPKLDGTIDSVWSKADAIYIPVNYGWAGAVTVTLRALYTEEKIYFLAQWNDPTLSDRCEPWVKVSDSSPGAWMKTGARIQDDAGATDNGWLFTSNGAKLLRTSPPDDAAYEDKFSIIWGARDSAASVANVTGFKKKGCAILCHISPGDGTSNVKKFTHTQGEVADMWQWKMVRTGTVGFMDDQYIDATRPSTETISAGLKSDPGDAYTPNTESTAVVEDGAPKYTGRNQPVATDTAGFDAYAIPFKDSVESTTETLGAIEAGQEIAGVLVRPLTGDRGNIRAQVEDTSSAGYDAATNTWTLEFSRNLTTESSFDVQFDDLEDTYYFGVSVFDNARIEHSFNKGVYALEFMPNVEITFTDIKGHWAKKDIESLATRGIVIGYPEGVFRPDKPATRAEFFKMVMESMGMPLETTTPGSSLMQPDAWFLGYIAGAKKAGLTPDTSDTASNQSATLTREEASDVFIKALKLYNNALSCSKNAQQHDLGCFSDNANISGWAVPPAAEASRRGIIKGYPNGTLKPRDKITRAESAAMVNRSPW